MESPFELFYKNRLIATISSYGYETPWALGKADFKDPHLKLKLANAWSFLNDDDNYDETLSVEEENQQYKKELDKLGVTDDILDMLRGEDWTIILSSGEVTQIYSPIFDNSDTIEWRL